MRMSKFILVAVVCLGAPCWAGDGTKTEKGPFYLALASMAPEAAAYTFLLDQHLELKCGRGQSINHLKALSGGDGNMLRMILALKAGNASEARNLHASLPCEDTLASTKHGTK